ncbi:MAG: hypothetical protein GY702_14825, partial [Desulfobulbaceae bacterium]|nr:hypothetical protein [Desulfobulbaceae bacterium]
MAALPKEKNILKLNITMDKNETSPQATGEMTVTHISFSQLSSLWSLHRQTWQWNNPFVTPAWLTAWWTHFADKNELLLLKVCFDDRPVGVAPLMVKNSTATFIGSTDLCDLGDFIVEPGFHSCFYQAILDYLHQHKIHHLVLEQVQPGSHVY